MNTIETCDLVCRYGEFEAVKGISLQVRPGESFALLGPNGAGKTTTIRVLTTLMRPTSGWASVAGFNVATHPDEVRSRIGLVFQEPSLDLRLTAEENLRFHARLYRVPFPAAERRIQDLLELVELAQRQHELVHHFSGGMRRRLEIARALVHAPRVLFLDEPTTGLDPQTRARIWEYIEELRQREGTTVFMTTHYIEEAEHCQRVAIMDAGRIVACEHPTRLKAQLAPQLLTLYTSDPGGVAGDIERLFQMEARPLSDRVVLEHSSAVELIPKLLGPLGGRVSGVELRQPTLEDVFLKLTGRSLAAGER